MAEKKSQTEGRRKNDALPLGRREGGDTEAEVKRQGRKAARSAGPDGPSAKAVGDTFKAKP